VPAKAKLSSHIWIGLSHEVLDGLYVTWVHFLIGVSARREGGRAVGHASCESGEIGMRLRQGWTSWWDRCRDCGFGRRLE
jgi:hypothetical protein